MRTWTSTAGKTIEAEFVNTGNGRVMLRGTDGTIMNTSVSGLSKEDQTFIQSHASVEPRIFIGVAWKDRLVELRDKSKWAETAPHVGLMLHPHNINKKSDQIAIMKEIAPYFGVRDVIIERNNFPTEEDATYRIKMVRDTLNLDGNIFFYINKMFTKEDRRRLKKDFVPKPSPELFSIAKHIKAEGAIPLFAPTPHVVFIPSKGFSDPGWDFLRDFSVLQGYCYDAPAELYAKKGEHYRKVVEDSIRYANEKGAYSVYLLSAHKKAAENVAYAKDVVRDLKKRNALPYAWAIEDYTKTSDLPMTPERKPDGTPADTITGLALWIREFYAGKQK
jgi:hypothetical protein